MTKNMDKEYFSTLMAQNTEANLKMDSDMERVKW
jgi:hypothetical protein